VILLKFILVTNFPPLTGVLTVKKPSPWKDFCDGDWTSAPVLTLSLYFLSGEIVGIDLNLSQEEMLPPSAFEAHILTLQYEVKFSGDFQ
jgi:hypothetical protein